MSKRFLARTDDKATKRRHAWQRVFFLVAVCSVFCSTIGPLMILWPHLHISVVTFDEPSIVKGVATPPKATVAYLTSITACPDKTYDQQAFLDGAAVLQHSIHLNSIRTPESGSMYDYTMYAFVHPDAMACQGGLEKLGYQVLIKDTPVAQHEIQKEPYRTVLFDPQTRGCCGEKELLKLFTYTMHDYPIAVHLDLDILILKPLDELFDVVLMPDNTMKRIHHALRPEDQTRTLPVEALFTRDYVASNSGTHPYRVGMQGGFLIVRPNQTAFDELLFLLRQGNFDNGWYEETTNGRIKYPNMYGAPQIQGLLGFYYGHRHPQKTVELHHCYHNAMNFNKLGFRGLCRVPVNGECEDCGTKNVTELYSAHLTLCGKPQKCPGEKYWQSNLEKRKIGNLHLCRAMHERWHRTRYDLERKMGIEQPYDEKDSFYGHCDNGRYISLNMEL
eukprot:scaffold35225_cov183-Amphora_coffeaeformis.AAC.3